MKATDRNKNCLICGKVYFNPYGVSKKQWGERKYCSIKCSIVVDIKRKLNLDEEKHPRWKGDKVGYYGVHDWITKHYGQPSKCEACGLNDPKRKYHWANLDLKYKRNIESWRRMCVSCHRKYDNKTKREN